MKRKIIQINEKKCNGCGECIPNCPEGAIQMIDGKARLISDLFCDGLGACIGKCPVGAITVEEREAEAYDEEKVMRNIVKQGANVIKAHLDHLRAHGEEGYLKTAVEFLRREGIGIPEDGTGEQKNERPEEKFSGCPGSRTMRLSKKSPAISGKRGDGSSELGQWPVQLHLIPAAAPFLKKKDLVLSADCVAYSLGDFHGNYLKGKALAIACPKLDTGREVYLEKLVSMIDGALINTLTVMIMEVPCCGGLLALAEEAVGRAQRKVPVKKIVVGINGDVKEEKWI
ncbi:MAG: 4Fe-4S dicluster domain-containing protein [Candidatus Omnitrophica bacterium]|nr:4Fe-4S dicluster domain-containing protein [Candidatus Omnitrophota bacterium]